MRRKYNSHIIGEFEGWDGDTVYELDNGTRWQLSKYKYKYKFSYRPKAIIWVENGRHYLEVKNMKEVLQVVQV